MGINAELTLVLIDNIQNSPHSIHCIEFNTTYHGHHSIVIPIYRTIAGSSEIFCTVTSFILRYSAFAMLYIEIE